MRLPKAEYASNFTVLHMTDIYSRKYPSNSVERLAERTIQAVAFSSIYGTLLAYAAEMPSTLR